jgi:hypothetical protein
LLKSKSRPLLALLLALSLLSWAGVAFAGQDTPTFGVDMNRNRRIDTGSTAWASGLIFNPKPNYLDLGPVLSYTEPTVAQIPGLGDTALQYAYAGSDGYLYYAPVSQASSGGFTGVSGYFNFNDVATAGNPTQDVEAVSGPTVADGWVAIAVGQYIWAWPAGDVPGPNTPIRDAQGLEQFNLFHNPGNHDFQDSMSPAVFQAGGQVYACAGGWSGDFTCADLTTDTFTGNYVTTWTNSSSGTADITSSPVYDASGYGCIGTGISCAGVGSSPAGDGAVIFGISGVSPGWLVAMDPVTGAFVPFGSTKNGISSSPVLSSSGNLYVPDNGGNIYVFDSAGNQVQSLYVGGGPASDITDLALGEYYLYGVEDGLTRLYAFTRLLSAGSVQEAGSWAPGGGQEMFSPSLVWDASDGYSDIFLGTNGGIVADLAFGGGSALPSIFTSNGSGFTSGAGFVGTELQSSPLTAYDAVTADVGPDHMPITFVQDPSNQQGAIEYWLPAQYAVTASFDHQSVVAGSAVTLTANVTPTGITYQGAGGNNSTLPGDCAAWGSSATNPQGPTGPGVVVESGLTGFGGIPLTCNGQPDDSPLTWQSAGTWQGTFYAPSKPGNYVVTVQAVDEAGQTVQAQAPLTVLPNPQASPGDGTLVLHSYGVQPGGTTPYGNWPEWTDSTGDWTTAASAFPYTPGAIAAGNGYYLSRYGDYVHARLTVSNANIQQALQPYVPLNCGWWIDYWGLTSSSLQHLDGHYGPSGTDLGTTMFTQNVQSPMLLDDKVTYNLKEGLATVQIQEPHGAQVWFRQNWSGQEKAGFVITTYPANAQRVEDLGQPSWTGDITANATAKVTYTYIPKVQEEVCSSAGKCQLEWVCLSNAPATVTVDVPITARAQMEVIGTDWFIIPHVTYVY